MSTEIINARSSPLEGGPPPYYNQKTRPYNKSAETKAKQDLFLEGYVKKGTLSGAARYAGIHVSNHHRWIEIDPDYPEQFQAALLEAKEALVEEGRRRALEGVEEPTGWYKGEPGGFVRRYSDALLIFLIKGAFPDIYKDRHEHTGKNGGPIEVQSTVTIEQFPVWLKQAIVVISSGVQIDPEVERVLMSHFEDKFLEAEKLVGSGTTSQASQPTEQAIEMVEIVAESTIEIESEPQPPVESIEPRPDWRPAKKVSLDIDDI